MNWLMRRTLNHLVIGLLLTFGTLYVVSRCLPMSLGDGDRAEWENAPLEVKFAARRWNSSVSDYQKCSG